MESLSVEQHPGSARRARAAPEPGSAAGAGADAALVRANGATEYVFASATLASGDYDLACAEPGQLHAASHEALATPGLFDPATNLWRRVHVTPNGTAVALAEDVPPEDGCDGERALWPATFVMADFLAARPAAVRAATVLELGAGCGLPAMAAAAAGARAAWATEQDRMVPWLEAAVALGANAALGVEVAPLLWGDRAALGALRARAEAAGAWPFDTVVACDCTYAKQLHGVFADTLAALLRAGSKRVWLAHDDSSTPLGGTSWAAFVALATADKGLRVRELAGAGEAWRARAPDTMRVAEVTLGSDGSDSDDLLELCGIGLGHVGDLDASDDDSDSDGGGAVPPPQATRRPVAPPPLVEHAAATAAPAATAATATATAAPAAALAPALATVRPDVKQKVAGAGAARFDLPPADPGGAPPVACASVPGAPAYVLDGVLTPAECARLVAAVDASPELSFWSSGGGGGGGVGDDSAAFRNADTIEVAHAALAARLWARCAPFLGDHAHAVADDDDAEPGSDGLWRAAHLNPDLLFAKYPPGGSFAPHSDGSTVVAFNERSFRSVIVYLTDCPAGGGGTRFYADGAAKKLERDAAGRWTSAAGLRTAEVEAKAGRVLVFDQSAVHEGVPPAAPFGKHIIRSDVMYTRDPPRCDAPRDREAFALYLDALERADRPGREHEAVELFSRAGKMSPGLRAELRL